MKARLIALCIEPDQAGCIRELVEEVPLGSAILLSEQAVELGIESVAAAKKLNRPATSCCTPKV
jgi:hypothetical protein